MTVEDRGVPAPTVSCSTPSMVLLRFRSGTGDERGRRRYSQTRDGVRSDLSYRSDKVKEGVRGSSECRPPLSHRWVSSVYRKLS